MNPAYNPHKQAMSPESIDAKTASEVYSNLKKGEEIEQVYINKSDNNRYSVECVTCIDAPRLSEMGGRRLVFIFNKDEKEKAKAFAKELYSMKVDYEFSDDETE